MKKPNFFIIGALGCGTASLATWLSEHPNACMAPGKEPFSYYSDLNMALISDPAEYYCLFKKAGDQYVTVGEASTLYLYSQVAVPRIEQVSEAHRGVLALEGCIRDKLSYWKPLVLGMVAALTWDVLKSVLNPTGWLWACGIALFRVMDLPVFALLGFDDED